MPRRPNYDVSKLPVWTQNMISALTKENESLRSQLTQLDADNAHITWGGYGNVPRHGIPKELPIHVHLEDGTEFEIRWFPDLLHIAVNNMNRQLLIAPYVSNTIHIKAAPEVVEDVYIRGNQTGGVLSVDEPEDNRAGIEHSG